MKKISFTESPIKTSDNANEEIPPKLPPKLRQRRQCQEQQAKQQPDHLQLLLQRQQRQNLRNSNGNGFSNILYARRLPSPPVVRRLLQGQSHDLPRSKDDSLLSQSSRSIANHLSKQSMRKLFCPLCTQTFGFGFALECHLLSAHVSDLESFTGGLSQIKAQNCPKCRAQFIKPGLVVSHLILHHPQDVVNVLMLRKSEEFLSDRVGCTFCGQEFMRRHQKLLLCHIEQRHGTELEELLLGKVGNEDESTKSIEMDLMLSSKALKEAMERKRKRKRAEFQPQSSSSSLDDDHQFVQANDEHIYYDIEDDKENKKRERSSEEEMTVRQSTPYKKQVKKKMRRAEKVQESEEESKMIVTPFATIRARRSFRRPAKNETQTFFKRSLSLQREPRRENSPPMPKTPIMPLKSSPIRMQEMPIKSPGQMRLFKCNLCEDAAFLENAFLLTHLKNKHKNSTRGMLMLKPQYSCGVCPAKFFKNSFLVRHAECHQFELVDLIIEN